MEKDKSLTLSCFSILFELKSIADVGLVGFPNAGKSSILYTASRASPKIASYPFTTLHPSVGVVQVCVEERSVSPSLTLSISSKFNDYSSFSLCDIPGIVEGASQGRGLGLEFLRHIERTRVLAFVVEPVESEATLQTLIRELDQYDPKLRASKRCVLALNKMDLPNAEQELEMIGPFAASLGIPVFGISAAKKIGMNDFLLALRNLCMKKD